MSGKHSFRAVIEQADGGGAYITIPFDVEKAFGKKRVPVMATIDGEPYRGSLVRMGGPCHILGVLKEIRARLGKQVGDEVEVTVWEDAAPRAVEVPAGFQEALNANNRAKAFFDTLSYSRQREYVLWIEEAKREQTRMERISRAVELLAQGKKLR
ncbi:MAG: DUF1905 domain-containing protein [Patescibacteria group bacterium]